MSPPRGWRWLFRNPFRDRAEADDIRAEVAFHLDEIARRLEQEGVPPDEAARRARERFGDPRRWTRRAVRASRAGTRARSRRDALVGIRSDLRMAFRQMMRRPLFTALALTVMTVGIASGTSVWAVLDPVLFRPLPFPEADRVVAVFGSNRRSESWWISRHAYDSYQEGQRSFEAMAAYNEGVMAVLEPYPEEIGVLSVGSGFFDVVDTEPLLGRGFTAEEDEAEAPDLLILTWSYWRERFDGDRDVIGREVAVEGGSARIVGVMPPTFRWEAQQWDGPAPEGAERVALRNRIYRGDDGEVGGVGRLIVLGRLRAGVTVEEAQADLSRIGRALVEAYPVEYGDAAGWGAIMPNVKPIRWVLTRMVADDVLLLGGAAILLLLLIAVNAGSLLATRVLDRRPELAVRASLGAARSRLVRQVLVETGVLWTVALGLGLFLAATALPVIRSMVPPETPLVSDFHMHPRVVLGALAVALLLWGLSGILPASDGWRVDLVSASGGRSGGPTRRRTRLQRGLIVVQIALACGLLTGAALLLRSYASLRAVEVGLDPDDVALLHLRLPARFQEPSGTMADFGGPLGDAERWFEPSSVLYRPGARFMDFVSGTLERMERVPGVEGATFVNQPPLWNSLHWLGARIPADDAAEAESPWIRVKWVTPGYFETLGIPILRGRPLRPSDHRESTRVLVVNEAFVREALRVDDPVGRAVTLPFPPWVPETEWTIVGVVPPVIHYGPHEPGELVAYMPLAQIPEQWTSDQIGFTRRASFLARYRGDRAEIFRRLREAVWEGEPDLPIRREATLEELYGDVTAEPRFFLVLLGSFAAVALFLSAVGVLAALGQHVRRRTREMGVRKALGADAGDILGRILRDGAALGLLGAVLGTGLAWILARVLAAQVVGVSGWSPAVQAAVALALVGTAVLSALPPAIRATRVEAMEVLRRE